MNPFPEIKSRHSALARISESELDILKEIFDDADTRRFLPELYELLDYPDGLQNFIATFVYYSQNDEGYLWGIKHNGVLIGFVAVMDLSYVPAIFYAMHPAYRSQGFMKDAISAVLDYLEKYTQCHNVSTDVYKENSVSIHILKQLGYSVCKEDDDKVYMLKMLV